MHIEKPTITVREKLTILLVLFIIKMIKPWEYDHQFKEFWTEIKTVLDHKEETTKNN